MQTVAKIFNKYYWLFFVAVFALTAGLLFPLSTNSTRAAEEEGAGFDVTGGRWGEAPDSGIEIPADIPDDIDLEQCAWDLTNYMNDVLDEVGDTNNAILTSIAFNLTSHFEWAMFQMMQSYEADFDKLDAMSGNTYTRHGVGDSGIILAYDWYETQYGWKASFGGKPMVFTEYGDFATHDLGLDYYRDTDITSMKSEFGRAAVNNGDVVVYFAPFADQEGFENPEFEFHAISDEHLQEIVSASPRLAGANSARELDSGHGFANKVAGLGMRYTVEIITGPSDIAEYINNMPGDMIPVIRLCWGNSCGFQDPRTLADYINELDAATNRQFHILVGPNEPLTDPWVSPACGNAEERDYEWKYAPCELVYEEGENEWHSLRPYPGSANCSVRDLNKGEVAMCANRMVAKQILEITMEGINTDSECSKIPEEQTLTYTNSIGDRVNYLAEWNSWRCPNTEAQAEGNLTVNLTDAELPVLGNTEDVPNGSQAFSGLTYEQRVNNFVSWYLQGAVPTAEEEFAAATDPQGLRAILNFSGPIQKLMPWSVMNKSISVNYTCFPRPPAPGIPIPLTESQAQSPLWIAICQSIRREREELPNIRTINASLLEGVTTIRSGLFGVETTSGPMLKLRSGDDRHNQIVVCGGGFPEACYSRDGQTRLRRSNLRNPLSLKYPYIPISTTEDVIGQLQVKEGSLSGLVNEEGSESSGFPPEAETPWEGENPLQIVPIREGPNANDYENNDDLFYAHTYESLQLSRLLQSTYIPALTAGNSDSGMPGLQQFEYDSQYQFEGNPDFCRIVGTYQGPGDNLYGYKDYEDYACTDANPPGNATSPYCDVEGSRAEAARNIKVGFKYDSVFDCTFEVSLNASAAEDCMSWTRGTSGSCWEPSSCWANGGTVRPFPQSEACVDFPGEEYCEFVTFNPPQGTPEQCVQRYLSDPICTKAAMLTLDLETSENPFLGEIFNRLVNGNMSFFRRLFPRLTINNKETLTPELHSIIVPGPQERIVNVPAETNISIGGDGSAISENAEVRSTEGLLGPPSQGAGSTGSIYFPYLGTVHQHFLVDVQCALRPADIGCDNSSFVEEEDRMEADEACSIDRSSVDGYMQSAASKYGVPALMLEAIMYIEGTEYLADPDNFVCEENGWGAAGIMQVVRPGTYNIITCENERISEEEEFASCSSPDGQLSRCNPEDIFELAARVLLLKVGKWGYGPGRCIDLGDININDISTVYRAACNYYGSCYPDYLTIRRAGGLIPSSRWRDGQREQMGYADMVCAYMSMKNPSLGYCDSPTNYPPR